MAILQIRGRKVDVDIERELSRFTWGRARWMPDRLLAQSPFRYDSSPSFYCYLEDTSTAFAGSWGDSGGSGDYAKGHFTQLLAFLMDVSEHEVVDYLFAEYSSDWDGESELTLDLSKMRIETQPQPLGNAILSEYDNDNDYLARRGVSMPVRKLMQTGFDLKANAITIPYFLPDGRLATIKYRTIDRKFFFYHPEGLSVRTLLYGIDVIHAKKAKRAIITEAEIDAMYAMTCCKMPAIACGNSKLSDEKVDLVLRSPLEELLIASDNDAAGEALREQAKQKLGGRIRLYDMRIPNQYKDLNEIKDATLLKRCAENAEAVNFTLNFA